MILLPPAQLAAVFDALSHANRLRILGRLSTEGELSPSELAGGLSLERSEVSRLLKILQREGLVTFKGSGVRKWRVYSITPLVLHREGGVTDFLKSL